MIFQHLSLGFTLAFCNLSLAELRAMDGAVVAQFLETYRGRDKVYRLISYLSQCIAGGLQYFGHRNSAARFEALGGALSTCRVMLRLGDDLAMWQVTKSFGFGSQVRKPN